MKILLGRTPANEDRGDDLVDRFRERNRSSFFALIHLVDEQADGLIGDSVDLLADGADGDDSFPDAGR